SSMPETARRVNKWRRRCLHTVRSLIGHDLHHVAGGVECADGTGIPLVSVRVDPAIPATSSLLGIMPGERINPSRPALQHYDVMVCQLVMIALLQQREKVVHGDRQHHIGSVQGA